MIKRCQSCESTSIEESSIPIDMGMGCLLILIGLFMTALCVGFPVAVFGAWLFTQRRVVRRCRSCGHETLPMAEMSPRGHWIVVLVVTAALCLGAVYLSVALNGGVDRTLRDINRQLSRPR